MIYVYEVSRKRCKDLIDLIDFTTLMFLFKKNRRSWSSSSLFRLLFSLNLFVFYLGNAIATYHPWFILFGGAIWPELKNKKDLATCSYYSTTNTTCTLCCLLDGWSNEEHLMYLYLGSFSIVAVVACLLSSSSWCDMWYCMWLMID